MSDYRIAIPSYKRPEVIKKKTLSVLESYKLDPERINIFVADEEEYDSYFKSLKDTSYRNNLVIGVPKIGPQRNFIEKWYPEGTQLMMFDDDVEEIQRRVDEKRLTRLENLEKDFILHGFDKCDELGAGCFGIYAAANPYFMKDRIYTKISYIIASTFGLICSHDPFLDRITNHGEDYEYSIRRYIRDGLLCRFDYITVKSNYYKEEGGLQTIRTKDYVREQIEQIAEMFPDHCTMYTRKTTGFAELKLRDKNYQEPVEIPDNNIESFF